MFNCAKDNMERLDSVGIEQHEEPTNVDNFELMLGQPWIPNEPSVKGNLGNLKSRLLCTNVTKKGRHTVNKSGHTNNLFTHEESSLKISKLSQIIVVHAN